MSNITLHVQEEAPLTLNYVEAKIKPEVVGHATPTEEAQTVTPAPGTTFSAVEVDAIPPEYIVPTGTVTINENGETDVTEYASAIVNVPQPTEIRTKQYVVRSVEVEIETDSYGTFANGMFTLYALFTQKTGYSPASTAGGIIAISKNSNPSESEEFVGFINHFNGGNRAVLRKFDGSKIVTTGSPQFNYVNVALKKGAKYNVIYY